MSHRNSTRRQSIVVLTAVAFALAASAALWTNSPSPATGGEDDTGSVNSSAPLKPLFAETVPATNHADINLIVDGQKVLGWISGKRDRSGDVVKVAFGKRFETVIVQQDNTFTWTHRVKEPTDVTFSIGEKKRTTRIVPASATEPSVFFVVDRTAYRPGQTLHFAGFLRRPGRNGEFAPLSDEEVEVKLVSRSKKTTAAKLKLTSDDFGRITGEYAFSPADALDTYDLSIAGYKGSAELKLAEFRKAKVKLKIEGKLDGQNLKLTFRALDFLDKPVPGSNVHYKLQVMKQTGDSGEHALDADEFVYSEQDAFNAAFDQRLSEDDRLLRDAGIPVALSGVGRTTQFVAQREGDIVMGEQGQVEQTIPLEAEWTGGDYRVVVQGVLLDYNGREQRAVQSISIGKKTKDCNLELSLLNRFVKAGSKFQVHVHPLDEDKQPTAAQATIVAMRLEPSPTAMQGRYGYGYGYYGYYGRYSYLNYYNQGLWNSRIRNRLLRSAGGRPRLHWQRSIAGNNETVRRKTVNAVPVTDNVATLQLNEPGPYKLVCFAELPDGRKLQNEIGCIVREEESMPALILLLDRDELQTGDMLTGAIHSRFRDARVLLTMRDSSGIRFWKVIDLANGMHRLRQRLPAGLRYGCHIDVQYLDEDRLQMAGRFIRVEPVDRMVKVDVEHEELYRPGDNVTLKLAVNRQQPVDLVVSVYDQSLLGIAADRSKDVRNFYLADERVRYSVTQEKMRRMLAGVTVRELIERAETLLKEDEDLKKSSEGSQLQQIVNYYRSSNILYAWNLHLLFELAGVSAQPDLAIMNHHGWNWYLRFNKETEKTAPMLLLETISQGQSDTNQWKLNFRFAGETLTYFCYHDSHRNQLLQMGQLPGGMIFRGGYGQMSARGDARFSVTANGFFSHGVSGNSAISGQSFLSHMPTAGEPTELISADDPGVFVRRDFSDSAFWNATVRTDDKGEAKVTFKLPDSLTNWRVVVTAISRKMHVGQVSKSFRTYKPVMVWPMLPRVFTEGDTVELYAAVHNRTKKPQQMEVSLKVENGQVLTPAKLRVEVPAESQVPVYWTFQPEEEGFTQLLMTAKCAAGSDASLKRLPVSRLAAEQVVTASGLARNKATIVVPSDVVLANSRMELTLVPSLAEDMVESLDYLVQYPYGCVEQTMSRFLPAIRVAQTLERANIERPELEKKLPGVVAAGIKRLLELQKPDGGWGWQGGSQTHEMMTPYALYGLLQAEKAGYDIPNEQAIQRGISRLQQFINGMNEKQAADRIYCMYVYSHRQGLHDEWVKFIKQQAAQDKLSDYALALSLEMLVNRGADKQTISQIVNALQKRAVRGEGAAYWKTANFSRWGNDRFEITAAVLKALVAHNPEHELVPEILSFFVQTKRGNRWNSTKDTAMIIYAMCDYLATQDFEPGAAQNISLTINDGLQRDFRLTSGSVAKLIVEGTQLQHGANEIRFLKGAPGTMFRAVVRFWQKGKNIAPMQNGLKVTRQFYLLDAKGKRVRELKDGDAIPRGSYIESLVGVRRTLGTRMQYVLVANPKPSSSEILPTTDSRYNQSSTGFALREDKTYGVAWHHEQTGNQITDRCVLHVELAGDYTVPPAEVELMYYTQVRGHSASFRLRVEDRKAVASRE